MGRANSAEDLVHSVEAHRGNVNHDVPWRCSRTVLHQYMCRWRILNRLRMLALDMYYDMYLWLFHCHLRLVNVEMTLFWSIPYVKMNPGSFTVFRVKGHPVTSVTYWVRCGCWLFLVGWRVPALALKVAACFSCLACAFIKTHRGFPFIRYNTPHTTNKIPWIQLYQTPFISNQNRKTIASQWKPLFVTTKKFALSCIEPLSAPFVTSLPREPL